MSCESLTTQHWGEHSGTRGGQTLQVGSVKKKVKKKSKLHRCSRSSLVAQTVKHLATVQETRVQSLGWEDPLEKAMAPHSSTLAWKIPWMEEPGRLQSMGLQRQT